MKILKHLKTDWFRYGFETLAVIVGILVAFGLESWNEERKLKNEELELLADIQSNLEASIDDFIVDTISHSEDILLYNRIEYYVENDLDYSPVLDSAFANFRTWRSPYITSTAYNTLQSKGLDIISNEVLKNSIVNMYEVILVTLTDDYDQSEWNLSHTVVNPFFSRHIRILHNSSIFTARPNDFESLKKNDEFLNILSMIIRLRKSGLLMYQDTIKSMQKLVEDIKVEIESRT